MEENKNGGCLKMAGIGLVALFGIGLIGNLINPPSEASEVSATSAPTPDYAAIEEAEKRNAGFHCLSAWDGSHRELVNALKNTLREPDSFEHIDTRITPVSDEGYHVLMMNYRARNGFGGMNVGRLAATVKNSDCSFEVVANESG